MHSITSQQSIQPASPFDSIKQVRKDGTEHWSARDLMPMLGYGDKWQNFESAIDRAKIAAEVQGQNVGNLFTGVSKKTGGRPQQDYELARFACYLVAMNGDPRKPEIAAAMGYFAVKTREAETQTPAITKLSRLELLQLAMEAETERLALEEKTRELEPKAEAYDKFMDADGTYSVGNVAKMLGLSQNKLFDLLRNHAVFISKGHMRNTPYQQYMRHFAVKAAEFERKDGTRGVSYVTRVQPSGIAFVCRKLSLDSVVV